MKLTLKILLYIFVIILLSLPVLSKKRGFTKEETNQIFSTQNPVRQILGGYFPEDINISEDGKMMTFYCHNSDIKNNSIYVMNSDGTEFREIPTPYGYKSNPYLIGRNLYFNYTPTTGKKAKAKARGRKKGRFVYDLDRPENGYKLVFRKIINYTSHNQQSYFRPEKKGRKVKIQLLKDEEPIQKPYVIAKNIKPDYREIILDKMQKYFYMELIQNNKTKYKSSFFIYRAENKPGAKAELFIPGGISPSMGMTENLKDILIYRMLVPQTRHIYARNVKTGKNYYLVYCAEKIYTGAPVFSPVDDRFYFFAQYGTKVYGLFVSNLTNPDSLRTISPVYPKKRK